MSAPLILTNTLRHFCFFAVLMDENDITLLLNFHFPHYKRGWTSLYTCKSNAFLCELYLHFLYIFQFNFLIFLFWLVVVLYIEKSRYVSAIDICKYLFTIYHLLFDLVYLCFFPNADVCYFYIVDLISLLLLYGFMSGVPLLQDL